jgi:AraC-like DNA-binding protein
LFNQAHTCLVVPNAVMKAPLPSADPMKHAALRTKLIEATRDQLSDTPARVRHILRPLLMMGRCSVEEVARELGIHPRTLGRHLARDGLTFECLSDEMLNHMSHL